MRIIRGDGWRAAPVPLVLGLAWLGAASCSGYRTPPTTAAVADVTDANRTVIVIGRFASPASASVGWRDVGQSMSDALSRALLGDGRFDVLIIPELASRVDPIVTAMPRGSQASEIGRVRAAYPSVDYVVTGKVTDFHHTTDLSDDLARRGLFGRKNDALVAVKLNIVDLEARRIMAVDHIAATASAGKTAPAELYKGVDFDSYLFWSTPLGKATSQVIAKCKAHLATLMPSGDGDLRVTRLTSPRTIEVAHGRDRGLGDGQAYYLCTTATSDGAPMPLLDPDTRVPLRVRLRDVGPHQAAGLVLGKPPADFDPAAAVLRRELPALPPAETVAATSP